MTEVNINNEAPKPIQRQTRLQRLNEKTRGTVRFSVIFFSAIHIATIVIAAIYFNDCPVEEGIPKYLLAMGVLGLATKLISLFKDFIMKHIQVTPLLSFISTAALAVLIVASYYVYRVYEPSYDPSSGEAYCNKTLYLFAFIYITIIYSLLLLGVVAIGCFIFGLLVADKYVPNEETDAEETMQVEEIEEVSKAKN